MKRFSILLLALSFILANAQIKHETTKPAQTSKTEKTSKTKGASKTSKSSGKTAKSGGRSNSKSSNVYNVSTAQEFIDALGDNRTIVLQRSINLTTVKDNSLDINGFNNLTIKGSNPSIRLGVSNGQNLVLYFTSCRNVTVSSLVMGHEDVLWCGAGVVQFDNCENVNVSNCDIYGCGYYGIVLNKTNNFVCSNSNIHDCWVDMVDINDSYNVKFVNSILKDSMCGLITAVYSSSQVLFEKCSLVSTKCTWDNCKCFSLNCNITLKNCKINSNISYGDRNYITESGCVWY